MYITAHLVRSTGGHEGINAFVHDHGRSFAWPTGRAAIARLADEQPGTTRRERIQIAPGGNRVRAYLDILAPDRTPPTTIATALADLARDLDQLVNPVVLERTVVVVRFGVEVGLEPMRGDHLALLSRVATELLADA